MRSYILTLRFSGDWHVGLGAGRRGQADRLVIRDADGLPFVPAKTLTGIWRDACERIAEGLDNGTYGVWSQWVDVLFGSQPTEDTRAERYKEPPRPARLSVRSACLPEPLRALLCRLDYILYQEALTIIKPGVKIDADTGQAQEDHLRFEEVVRGGCQLTATATLDLEDKAFSTAEALLWAGAKTVERLGGKRRRGLGRCILVFSPCPDQEPALQLLGSDHPCELPAQEAQSEEPIPVIAKSAKDSEWFMLELTLIARTPIAIPERTVGNVVLSREGIPGTHLLGLVTRTLKKLEVDPFPYVATGDLQVLFAWPEIDTVRGLPVPFALFYKKEEGGLDKGNTVWNRFKENIGDAIQMKNHREGFLGPIKPDALPTLNKLALDMRTHNTVDDEPQRPTPEVGGVYTYQAIPAGAVLRSEIRLRRSLAETLANKCPDWWHSLEGQHRIGRAKKDDYGVVEIRCKSEPKALEIDMKDRLKLNQGTEAQREPHSPDIASRKSALTVWLLSDLLIRDERLRLTAQPEELGRVLKEELKVNELTLRRHGQLLSLLARVRRTESWHVGWGQPRPSLVGLAAGSCFMFDVEGTLDPKALVRLEREGLGERRAEGYGQIMFNSPLIGQEISKWQPSSKPQQEDGSGPAAKLVRPDNHSEVFAYARLLEQEVWRKEIQRRAQWLGADTRNRRKRFAWTEKKPTNTQLSTLRGVVASLRKPNTAHRKRITDWLNEVEAREKWDQDPITRVRSLITQDEVIWQWLEWPSLPVLTEGGEAELKTRLWPEAVRVVVNAAVKGETRNRERQ